MNDSIEHRADALFALPEIPESATVFGDPPGWRADLGARGIELTNGQRPDLAVAGPEHTRDALSSGAQAVLVDTSRTAAGYLPHARLWMSSLLPMPVHGTSVLYPNLGQRAASPPGMPSRRTENAS